MSDAVTAEDLIEKATEVAKKAYAPHSKFEVGAALLANGKIYVGCNVENASFGLTLCAERNAVGAAIADGSRSFEALAIFADADEPTPPCGACRQVLAEFGPSMRVHLASRRREPIEFGLDELLPHRFDFQSED